MSTAKSRKPEENLWYVHAPLKNEKRVLVDAPPPSNIPYLNGVADTDEAPDRKHLYFRDTDSDFVRLSKLGGREDLLIHKPKPGSQEPVGYPRPSWWTDMLDVHEETEAIKEEEKKPYVFEVPAWFAHPNKVKPEELKKVQPLSYPYAVEANSNSYNIRKTDAIEEPLKYGELRNYKNPIRIKPNNAHKPDNLRIREPPIEFKKMKSATTMHKLLGNSYQKERPRNYEEWKDEQDESSYKYKSHALSSRVLKQ